MLYIFRYSYFKNFPILILSNSIEYVIRLYFVWQSLIAYQGLRKVEMKTAVSRLRVACHHLSGKKMDSPGLIVHSNSSILTRKFLSDSQTFAIRVEQLLLAWVHVKVMNFNIWVSIHSRRKQLLFLTQPGSLV